MMDVKKWCFVARHLIGSELKPKVVAWFSSEEDANEYAFKCGCKDKTHEYEVLNGVIYNAELFE